MDMQEALDILVEALQGSGLDESELLQIRDMASQMFSTKEQIEALALEEIQLYHFGFGWGSLELSSPLVYDTLIPNPFGGDPFPAVGQLELVDFDQESGQAIIHSVQTLDPDATREILLDSLQEMAADLDTEPPTESDLPEPFSIETNLQLAVDSNSGWILSTESTQTVVVGPAMREETITIKDVTP